MTLRDMRDVGAIAILLALASYLSGCASCGRTTADYPIELYQDDPSEARACYFGDPCFVPCDTDWDCIVKNGGEY